MKVLVVESSPLVRHRICRSLRTAGIQSLVQAEGGQHALKLLARDVPNLIIIGIDVNGMSGLQFALRVRMSDVFGHVSMMMISRKNTSADIYHAARCGIDRYVVMPFVEDLLVSKVRQFIATGTADPIGPTGLFASR